MYDLFEDKHGYYTNIVIARYVRATSQLDYLCNAINSRQSIKNIRDVSVKINITNIQEVLRAIDMHDESQWVIHDKSRLGGLLNFLLGMPDAHVPFLINVIHPSEIIKIEAAFFEALSEVVYMPHIGSINTMNPYDIHINCAPNGNLSYHIQSPTEMFHGDIPIHDEKIDIERINSDMLYIHTVLIKILEIIATENPTHVDQLISRCIFQKFNEVIWSITNSTEFLNKETELVNKKKEFIKNANIELSHHVLKDLDVLLTPCFVEFQKFLNSETLNILNKLDNKPREKINSYMALMYKRATLLHQIPIIQAEMRLSKKEGIEDLSLNELEKIHNSLYEDLCLMHPNIENIKQDIQMYKKQIFDYSKIQLTRHHPWTSKFNKFEFEIDKAFLPLTFVNIHKQMKITCSDMQSTLMELQGNYELLWNEYMTLAEKNQLPIVEKTYIPREALLRLSKEDYDLEIQDLTTKISDLNDKLRPQYETNEQEIEALIDHDLPHLDIDLEDITDKSAETQSSSDNTDVAGRFSEFLFSFFQTQEQQDKFSDLNLTGEELEQLKTISKEPYVQFLDSKYAKNIKEEKRLCANQAIEAITQSTSPSEIHRAIQQSIVNAKNAKVSWFGAKTGLLIKTSLKAMENFEDGIKNIKTLSSRNI
jgi:hypothetical protein